MSDQPLQQPQFIDEVAGEALPPRPLVRAAPRGARLPGQPETVARTLERRLSFIGTLDRPLLVVIVMLLALGMMMVYSTTFYWSDTEFGSEIALLIRHASNVGIGLVAMGLVTLLDYRMMRRLAVIVMLAAISFLIAVLLFGDRTFGARRALINGRFQPGEFTELAIIIYMAAWLGSKRARIRSFTYGFIPFVVLVGIVVVLVLLQPDISTAGVIFATSFVMFFLAGADMRQILIAGGAAVVLSVVTILLFPDFFAYAANRIDTWWAGLNDLTQTNYQAKQAVIAFLSGGWTGVGLGEGRQKFLALPAPHTDSIFAVIGEELGVIGAALVLLLYVAFIIRAFQIARRAPDAFGALLATGVAVWVALKALLNVAVMTALLPTTGVPLPFISYGGSSLVVLLTGVGLLLSVHRGTVLQKNTPDRRIAVGTTVTAYDRSRRDGRTRLPRAGRSRGDDRPVP
ncbi:MAG: putative peptidoglycan glycosyltransferase FtsW [bacterium]|nr:putative peptidoglycan glycosyltransferase FtsW [bacterium]